MDRPRLIRGLRFAVRAVCGILCLLLIVLWVHSYWYRDLAFGRHPVWGLTYVVSRQGKISWYARISDPPRDSARWEVSSTLPEHAGTTGNDGVMPEGDFARSFMFVNLPSARAVVLPYWFLVAITLSLAAAPWIRWSKRFSLRTLLIATTLIAVLLATAAYLRLW